MQLPRKPRPQETAVSLILSWLYLPYCFRKFPNRIFWPQLKPNLRTCQSGFGEVIIRAKSSKFDKIANIGYGFANYR